MEIHLKNLQNRKLRAEPSKTLLDNVLEQRVDWMHACGKKGRCTSCKAIVLEGAENLSALTPHEQRMREQGRLTPKERQCCQAVLLHGEVVLKVPKAFQFPHMTYSE